MRYDNIRRGRFIARPNRFIALVDIDGKEVCHVKYGAAVASGSGAAVILQKSITRIARRNMTSWRYIKVTCL